MGLNPNERLTLAAVLSGLQGGMSGDQAMPLISSVMQARDARQASMKDMMMQGYGALTNFAGTAENNDASQAYLYAMQNAGILNNRRMQKLTDFNVGLYGGEDSRSPLYGLVGDMNRLSPEGADSSGVPISLSGLTDEELRAWNTSNPNLWAAVAQSAQGQNNRDEIYRAVVENAQTPAEAYFAAANAEAIYKVIDAYLGGEADSGGGFLEDIIGKIAGGLGAWTGLSLTSKIGSGGKLLGPARIPGVRAGLGAIVNKLPFIGGGAAAAAPAAAAAEAIAGAGATGYAATLPTLGAAEAIGGTGLMSSLGGLASTGYGLPLAAVIAALTLGGMKLGGSHMFGMNDNEGIW